MLLVVSKMMTFDTQSVYNMSAAQNVHRETIVRNMQNTHIPPEKFDYTCMPSENANIFWVSEMGKVGNRAWAHSEIMQLNRCVMFLCLLADSQINVPFKFMEINWVSSSSMADRCFFVIAYTYYCWINWPTFFLPLIECFYLASIHKNKTRFTRSDYAIIDIKVLLNIPL